MDSKKLLYVIPVVSALVLAVAVGVVAFSSSSAASSNLGILTEGDDLDELPPWRADFSKFGRGERPGLADKFDYDSHLAEALGVTITELEDARQAAKEAALEQAVAEGAITQEQADLIAAHQALMQYIDHQEIFAEALGIDLSDLEAARQEGKPLLYLFGELGLEPAEIKEALQSTYEDAVQQAIDDGVITESQAEQLQEKGFPGRGIGKRGGGFHGQGGFPFQRPAPEADGDL